MRFTHTYPIRRAYAPESLSLGCEYMVRAVKLQRAGKIPIVLVSQSKYYLASDPGDPWGSKAFISHQQLRALIDEVDSERKAA